MIFHPELAQAIVDGRKTVTRRPVKGDEPCRYKVGRTYAVQTGRGKKAVARILVLSVTREPAGAITTNEAIREGFRDPVGFADKWESLYQGQPWRHWWRIEFEVVA